MTILATTDLSQNSRPALRFAQEIATAVGQRLMVLNVVELWARDMGRVLETFDDSELKPSEESVQALRAFVGETLGAAAETVEMRVAVGHPPTEAIIAAADELHATMIVAGTSGHSKLGEAFFGSTTSALARQSAIPVLVVPPEAEHADIRTILAPVDLSECSERSLKYAGDLARWFDARIVVHHSAPFTTPAIAPPLVYIPESANEIRDAADRRVHAMAVTAELQSPEFIVEIGPPHGAILRAADEVDADLIVMGTHGRKGVERFFLGSTAERILRDRKCPVVVVRGEA